MRKAIYVYGVQGADFQTITTSLRRALPQHHIKIVDRAALLSPDFTPDRVAAFILPGGSRGEYDRHIGDDGFAAIKRFVAGGGVFAGFCAGAYYASRKIEWRMDCPQARREKTPGLAFFNGIARGPVRQLLEKPDGKWDWGNSSAVDVTVSGQVKPMKALYWGGP
ncbi:MAG: BPL-N domain-containing protein, partial [Pseudomonadota bacterium]